MPMWSPERGPYEKRIFREPDDEKETKAISIEDTAYWFADSQGESAAAWLAHSKCVHMMCVIVYVCAWSCSTGGPVPAGISTCKLDCVGCRDHVPCGCLCAAFWPARASLETHSRGSI